MLPRRAAAFVEYSLNKGGEGEIRALLPYGLSFLAPLGSPRLLVKPLKSIRYFCGPDVAGRIEALVIGRADCVFFTQHLSENGIREL